MPDPTRRRPTYTLATAPRSASKTATAAIAIFDVHGDPEPLRPLFGMKSLPGLGELKLVEIPGLDHALVCRIADGFTQIHVHAGPYVIEGVTRLFDRAGFAASDEPAEPRVSETALLEYWLAAAPSPLAIDLLLAQRRIRRDTAHPVADRRIDRLLFPPLVVAVGPPNAGKSSLLNALACRSVAVVSDQPGTTRDSVGAMLELDGLVVRWLDLPGFRTTDDPIESQAIRMARDWAAWADLVVSCNPDPGDGSAGEGIIPDLSVRTKVDLSARGADTGLSCSALTGQGLSELARVIRRRLLPDDILDTEAVWALPRPSDRVSHPASEA